MSACESKKRSLKESEIHAKIDSIVGERLQEINAKAMEDLNNRISIEVKAKTDSILAARQHGTNITRPDTSKTDTTVTP